ncbi:MAG: hypothetical protein RLZZ283_629 [Candidatus Parcubacteria bacterium]
MHRIQLSVIAFLIAVVAVVSLLYLIGYTSAFEASSASVIGETSRESFPPIEILMVGDISFDRYIRQVSEIQGEEYIFSCFEGFLDSFDYVVANLEGPITEHASVSMGTDVGNPDNFVFTFPTTSAQVLARHNISVVTLGNNHIANFGIEGITSTHHFLEMSGVGYFGGVRGVESVFRRSGISFVSYNEFGGQSPDKVAKIVADEKSKGNIVVVYAHWGDEYIDSVPRLRPIATQLVEAGADVIVGAHPHVVLPHEYIDGVPVFYSLGNFIFDQDWNAEVRSGLAVSLTISDGQIMVAEYPVTLEKDGRTCLK